MPFISKAERKITYLYLSLQHLQAYFFLMSSIRNIIFDLGNVIINLDFGATEQAFKDLVGEDYGRSRQINLENKIFERYEVGAMTEAEFIAEMQAATNVAISGQAIINAWNAMLLDIPAARLEMLLELRKSYKVFLLSNTNTSHLNFVYDYLAKAHQVSDFDERYFDRAFYSHLMELRKPNTAIYSRLLAEAGIKAEESIFIDDLEENIQGAAAVGINTIHHPQGNEIITVLQERGFLK